MDDPLNEVNLQHFSDTPTLFQTPEVKFGKEPGFNENFYINDQFLQEICVIVRQKTAFTDDFGKSLLAFMYSFSVFYTELYIWVHNESKKKKKSIRANQVDEVF